MSRLRRNTSKLATASAPRQQKENPQPLVVPNRNKFVRLTLWPLVAATFFMVSGGTYGTEEIVHGAGYGRAILILVLTPLLWSLPTAFMIGELSSALPFEGGYYAWSGVPWATSGDFRRAGSRSLLRFSTWRSSRRYLWLT